MIRARARSTASPAAWPCDFWCTLSSRHLVHARTIGPMDRHSGLLNRGDRRPKENKP
jgi:hypothetical protein